MRIKAKIQLKFEFWENNWSYIRKSQWKLFFLHILWSFWKYVILCTPGNKTIFVQQFFPLRGILPFHPAVATVLEQGYNRTK